MFLHQESIGSVFSKITAKLENNKTMELDEWKRSSLDFNHLPNALISVLWYKQGRVGMGDIVL